MFAKREMRVILFFLHEKTTERRLKINPVGRRRNFLGEEKQQKLVNKNMTTSTRRLLALLCSVGAASSFALPRAPLRSPKSSPLALSPKRLCKTASPHQRYRGAPISSSYLDSLSGGAVAKETGGWKKKAAGGLGYLVTAGACLTKVPQIKRCLDSGSVEGLSLTSQYLETTSLLSKIIYHKLHKYPVRYAWPVARV